jgi:hypothetical protein
MQFSAPDGSKHTSQMAAYQSSQKPPASSDMADKPSIQDDPEAMKLVDQLKQMGFSADDVAQAMDDGGGQQQTGAEATKAAPMQIPGMQ